MVHTMLETPPPRGQQGARVGAHRDGHGAIMPPGRAGPLPAGSRSIQPSYGVYSMPSVARARISTLDALVTYWHAAVPSEAWVNAPLSSRLP